MLGHHINNMTSGFDVKRRRYRVILEEGVFKVLSDACIKEIMVMLCRPTYKCHACLLVFPKIMTHKSYLYILELPLITRIYCRPAECIALGSKVSCFANRYLTTNLTACENTFYYVLLIFSRFVRC